MHFKPETMNSLKELFDRYDLDNGEDDKIGKFSEKLHHILKVLSKIVVRELGVERGGYTDDKVKKILELAALAALQEK